MVLSYVQEKAAKLKETDVCLTRRSMSVLLFSLSLLAPVQEKLEMLPLPLANERRPCVLVGRDNMALPASLISQIGYRCHPSLYTEGDPGEKVELVAGTLDFSKVFLM